MPDPDAAPFGAVLLADIVRATDIDPTYPYATDGDFHLARIVHEAGWGGLLWQRAIGA